LLVFAGILEGLHGFRRSDPAAQRAAWQSAGISVLIGVLLINATWFMTGALVLLVAGWFAVDAARYAWVGLRGTSSADSSRRWLLPALGNTAVVVLILVLRGRAAGWTVAVVGALRILGTAWNVLAAPVFTSADSGETVIDDLGLRNEPEAVALAERLQQEERSRAWVDAAGSLASS